MKIVILICLVMALLGCSPKARRSNAISIGYFTQLRQLNLDPNKYRSYQDYHNSVSGKMQKWLSGIVSPERLRKLFWDCHTAWKSQPAGSQDRLQWIDPYSDSLNLIMYRLAEIRTEESTRILIDLYCDPKAGWDAGAALGASDAVVKCGTNCLPFLKNKEKTRPDVARLIKLIESGANTGF